MLAEEQQVPAEKLQMDFGGVKDRVQLGNEISRNDGRLGVGSCTDFVARQRASPVISTNRICKFP